MEAFGADSVDLSIFASYNTTFTYRTLRDQRRKWKEVTKNTLPGKILPISEAATSVEASAAPGDPAPEVFTVETLAEVIRKLALDFFTVQGRSRIISGVEQS